MAATNVRSERAQAAGGRRRTIGIIGTATRVVLGSALLGAVAWGELRAGTPAGLVLGLVGFPAVVLVGHWARARRDPAPFRSTGPVGIAVNCAVGLAVYMTGWLVPALWFTSDAVVAFYGMSMLLAAVRGYAGCEVLAVSNWLLRRDDQVGCVVLTPVDTWSTGSPDEVCGRLPVKRATTSRGLLVRSLVSRLMQ
jgi:hypothetical protein